MLLGTEMTQERSEFRRLLRSFCSAALDEMEDRLLLPYPPFEAPRIADDIRHYCLSELSSLTELEDFIDGSSLELMLNSIGAPHL